MQLAVIPGALQVVAALLVMIVSASSCLAQASQPDANSLDEGPTVELPLPEAISEAEIVRYSDILCLSAAQAAAFRANYESYLDRDRQLKAKELPEMAQLGREVAAHSGSLATDPSVAKMNADLVSKGEAFSEKCRGNDQLLFSAIEPLLAEPQLPALQRVRNQRTRVFCANSLVLRHAARVDLALLVWELSREVPIEPTDRAAFELLLADYEAAAAHIALSQYRADRARSKNGSVLLASREHELAEGDQMRPTLSARNKAVVTQFRALSRKVAREEKKLDSLNRLYADLLADLLPDSTSHELLQRFLQQAYPEVYPDPYDVIPVLDSASELGSLTPEQTETIEAISTAFLEHQSAVNARMIDLVVRWFDEYAQYGATRSGAIEGFRADLDSLQSARLQNAQAALTTLLEVFGSQLPSEVQVAWGTYLQRALTQGRSAMGLSYQPEADRAALILMGKKMQPASPDSPVQPD